jgi:hypothetical protein
VQEQLTELKAERKAMTEKQQQTDALLSTAKEQLHKAELDRVKVCVLHALRYGAYVLLNDTRSSLRLFA